MNFSLLCQQKNSQTVLYTLRVDDDDTLLDFRVHVMCLRGECLWVARWLNLCNMEGETYQFGFAIVLQIHLTICTSFNLVLTFENLNNRPTPLDQSMQIIVFLRCYNFYLAIPLLPEPKSICCRQKAKSKFVGHQEENQGTDHHRFEEIP